MPRNILFQIAQWHSDTVSLRDFLEDYIPSLYCEKIEMHRTVYIICSEQAKTKQQQQQRINYGNNLHDRRTARTLEPAL